MRLHSPAHAFIPSETGKLTHVVEAGGTEDVVEEGTAGDIEDELDEVTEATIVEDLFTEAIDVSELVEERVGTEDSVTVTKVVRVVVV